MDRRENCRAEEITKQQCIDRLTALGELVEVETFQVSVQMLSSYTFSVTMDSTDNKVSRLKALIEDTQGTKPYLQDLIVVPQAASGGESKDAEMGEGEGAALAGGWRDWALLCIALCEGGDRLLLRDVTLFPLFPCFADYCA